VDRRRLKECQNKKDEIEAMKYKRNTFKIKSRKDMSRFPDMETRLYAWVMENRIKGVCIGGLAIQQEGRKLHQVYLNQIR
jgi:hypothetical protein